MPIGRGGPTMYEALKELKDNDRVGDFLFPGVPTKIKGKVMFLSREMVVIESETGGQMYQYITHPTNICIVQRK
jgi:hypothetical protein